MGINMKLSGIYATFLAGAMALSASGTAEASGQLGLDAFTLTSIPEVGDACCYSAGWLFTANTNTTVIGLRTRSLTISRWACGTCLALAPFCSPAHS